MAIRDHDGTYRTRLVNQNRRARHPARSPQAARLIRWLAVVDAQHGTIVDMCDPKATLRLALDTLARGGAFAVTVEP
jgi:hypothetical protein